MSKMDTVPKAGTENGDTNQWRLGGPQVGKMLKQRPPLWVPNVEPSSETAT